MIDDNMPTVAEEDNSSLEPVSANSQPAEQGLYTWQGHERTWLVKGKSWYVYAAVVVVLLLVYAVLTQAWLMAILISLLSGIVYLYSQEKAPAIDVVVSDRGIYVGEEFYPYALIKSFWFQFLPEEAYVVFQLVNSTRSHVAVSIDPNERSVIEVVLKDYLVSDEFHRETFWEKIEKLF